MATAQKNLNSSGVSRMLSADFVEPDEPFQDDDLLATVSANDLSELMNNLDVVGQDNSHHRPEKNYLERDDFEEELGSPANDAFSEDFSDIAKYEVIDVVGTDRAGRILIVAYAYRLPSNKMFDHAKFLRYLTSTLDKYVNQDYTIIYFHYGLNSTNKPSVKWLFQTYRVLDRRYKKNLKALYLVHPTNFIKILWNLFKPIISKKFEKKLNYVNYLSELKELVRSDQLIIPSDVIEHDLKLRMSKSASAILPQELLPSQQFGVTLQFILQNNNGRAIPTVLEDATAYIRKYGLTTEGLFRRSAALPVVKSVHCRINSGEKVNYGQYDGGVHLAAVIIKNWFRELQEPIMTFPLFTEILTVQELPTDQRPASVKSIVKKLPLENYTIVQYLIRFLCEVVANSQYNLMNASNLAVVFGPNMAWPKDGQTTLHHLHHLNNFTYRLLTNYQLIFEQ